MPDERSFDLVQQLQARLESLRAAGVQFVPRGSDLDLSKTIAPSPDQNSNRSEMRTASTSAPAAERPPSSGSASLFAQPKVSRPDSVDARRQSLRVLANEVSGCKLCSELYSTRTQTVFGVGPLDPDIAFVGEAPGADEDRQGEPFVGRAGQLLNRIIIACGFARNDVYIFNTLKCRPPSNRTPTTGECDNCRPFFERQFDLVNPKYVVALGATAAKALLQTTTGIGKLRGKMYQYRDRPLIVTYHPSALLRDESGALKRDCWEDMKFLLRTMGKPIPDAKRND